MPQSLGEAIAWLHPQTSEEAARSLHKLGFNAFLKLGILLLGVGMSAQAIHRQFHVSVFCDAIVLAAAGYGVGRFRSRLSALTIGIVFSFNALAVLAYQVRAAWYGWFFLVVYASLAFFGMRAFEICIKYHRLRNSRLILRNVLIKNVFACVYFVIIGALIVLGFGQTLEQLGPVEGGFVTLVLAAFVLVFTYAGYLPFVRNKPFVTFRN